MRSRSMTSTVLGTSAIARSVRVAVTTTRVNSVGAASAGAASAAGESPWAMAMPGSARHSANDNRLGRMKEARRRWERSARLASGSCRVAGGLERRHWGAPGAAGSAVHGRGREAPDLLGQDQLVVAGMPQPVALVAVADQQFALALEQAGAVDFARIDHGWGFGGVMRVVGRDVCVRLDGEHRSTPSIRVTNANDSHLPVKHLRSRLRHRCL